MMLPKYKKRIRLRIMVCRECKNQYLGHPISKYCLAHRDIKNRKPKKKIKPKDLKLNQTIVSKAFDPYDMCIKCALRGCHNFFIIRVFPRQYLYPRYCPEHRTEYRRKRFKEQRRL